MLPNFHDTIFTFTFTFSYQLLLSRGGAVEGSMNNPADITTETPLQLAAAAGDIEIVELLLEKGADPFLSSSIHSSGSSKEMSFCLATLF